MLQENAYIIGKSIYEKNWMKLLKFNERNR